MSQLYPHLTAVVDTEPFFHDLVQEYSLASSSPIRFRVRQQATQRALDMDIWLVAHGLQCGRDYQAQDGGYRFASESLATFFRLAWS